MRRRVRLLVVPEVHVGRFRETEDERGEFLVGRFPAPQEPEGRRMLDVARTMARCSRNPMLWTTMVEAFFFRVTVTSPRVSTTSFTRCAPSSFSWIAPIAACFAASSERDGP